jgi:suppressor for copper-sensitivity B
VNTLMSTLVRAVLLSVALFGVTATSTKAAVSDWTGDQHSSVRLVTASDSISGDTIEAGLEFKYSPGWHGYWRTPGDAGIAPVFNWSKSSNFRSASPSWPAPSRLVIQGLQNSVYQGQFVIPVDVTVLKKHVDSRLTLALDYAACTVDVCVPRHADLSLNLPAGSGSPSAEAASIAIAKATVPKPLDRSDIKLEKSVLEGTGKRRHLIVTLQSTAEPFRSPDLFVEGSGSGIPPAPAVKLFDGGHRTVLDTALPAPTKTDGSVLKLTVVDGSRSVEFAGPGAVAPPVAGIDRGLLAIIPLALLGGLILNLMPCVLPILSIKLFSLAKHAGAERRTARLGAVATAGGMIFSFVLLAAVLSGLKLSGAALGWGIQFQQPWFLTTMAVVTTLFAASFFDWLSINLPQTIAGRLDAPARGPMVEGFVSGAFSTLLATPCSAPFVGTAVGFALARNPLDILIVFVCLGIGMALPFLAVAAAPRLVAWLPRPGKWMVRVRQVLGVLLLGTTLWLLYTLWTVAGAPVTLFVAVLLVATLGLRALVTSRYAGKGYRWPTVATAGLATAAVVASFAASQSLVGPRADQWQSFDPVAIDALVADGKTVFVDVSASWCLTCKVNELRVLQARPVRARLAQAGTVRMRADWSRPDPVIAAYIQRFGRFGIPLDVVYGPHEPEGRLLPEILGKDAVIHALDDAGNNHATSAKDEP